MRVGFDFIYLFVVAVVLAHGSKKSYKLQRNIFNSNLEMEGPSNSGMQLKYYSHIL
jgi:hypothetical protein